MFQLPVWSTEAWMARNRPATQHWDFGQNETSALLNQQRLPCQTALSRQNEIFPWYLGRTRGLLDSYLFISYLHCLGSKAVACPALKQSNYHTTVSHKHTGVPQINFQTQRRLVKVHGPGWLFSLLARVNLSQGLLKAHVPQCKRVRRISEHSYRRQFSPLPEFWRQYFKESCLKQPN